VALVVTNFTLSASPSSQSVSPGGAASYNLAITPVNGFTGQVTFSVSGLPGGATAAFSPNPATGSSMLSVTTTTATPSGSSTLTITGASGSLTHTTTVTLVLGVQFDNAVSSGIQSGVTSITTPAFVVGNGAYRAAMIMVFMTANNATSITAKLGGVNATLVAGTDSGMTSTERTMIFQVINPPSGSQTAVVSWTTTMSADVGVITVTGANQNTPVANGTFTATNSATGTTTSLTITSGARDLTATVAGTTDSWATPSTNETLKWGLDSGAVGGDIGLGTGTTTHIWTGSSTGVGHTISGANFKHK
jgi:hypothetical protein